MQKPALYTAAFIFAIVAIAHFVRYFLGLEFILGAVAIPLSVSLIAGIVTALLTVWMILAGRSR
jgi:hypothetical protein